MNAALLGTGTMGAGMARSLLRAGIGTTVWNRTAAKAEPLAADGAVVARSVGEAVAASDAVLTVLFDVDAVLAITDELVANLHAGAVWLQCSTVGPQGMARIAERVGQTASRGNSTVALLDTPVLGTKQPAEQGALTVLASGASPLIDQVEDVMSAIGNRTVRCGDRPGDASAVKLACNAWIATITAATAQSLALTSALGVDGSLFLRAIDETPTNSPYAQLKGNAMLEGRYDPAFALDGLRKDLGLMADASHGTAFNPDFLHAVQTVYQRASEAGHGEDDISAVRAAWLP